MNTMIYMRGNSKDFDRWEELGNRGWSFRDCLLYFKKLEAVKNPQMARNGTSYNPQTIFLH